MVILQFNKLIRNKWVWGAFAVAISAFFCLDDVIVRGDRGDRPTGSAGKLAGEDVDSKLFESIVEELRGIGNNRDYKSDASEINRRAWENYASLMIADRNGLEATDAEVMAQIRRTPAFQRNGAFSFSVYEATLRANSLTPERYEASVKRSLTLGRVARQVLGSAVWASPMEVERAVADMTDVLTVKVATFTEDKAAADAVTIDDAGVKAWYDENVKSLELPERVKIRYAAFDVTKPEILAAQKVTDEDLRDRYDTTIDKYTSTDTNGVETVKAFEDVKDEIEKDLRKILALDDVQLNLNQRAYGQKAAPGASRLDEIAKECGVTVETSEWFATDGDFREGFMKRAYQILPGAKGFAEAVAELDSENEDLRYGIVAAEKTVWLIEKAEVSPKHTPTFDEAKEIIRPRALKAAKAEAFKKSVDAVAAQGRDAVLASGNVSTNLTFVVSDLKAGQIPDQSAVARAAAQLEKGAVSEFTHVNPGRAVLVVCEDRVEGDAAKAMVLKTQIQSDITMLAANEIPASWQKWNLEHLGFETTDLSSVEKTDIEE